jgi:peptidoglycan-N-acetylglucosamine deacetylase
MSGLVEALFERFWHVEPVDPSAPDLALRIALQRYKGTPIDLADGTRVLPGDGVIELHMRNDLLASLHVKYDGDAGRIGVAYYSAMRKAMKRLAARWASEERFEGFVACYGLSIFPEHLERGGFEIHELFPVWRRVMLSWWTRRVVASFHPEGRKRTVVDGRPLPVLQAWMSRGRCMALFARERRGSAGEDLGEAQAE